MLEALRRAGLGAASSPEVSSEIGAVLESPLEPPSRVLFPVALLEVLSMVRFDATALEELETLSAVFRGAALPLSVVLREAGEADGLALASRLFLELEPEVLAGLAFFAAPELPAALAWLAVFADPELPGALDAFAFEPELPVALPWLALFAEPVLPVPLEALEDEVFAWLELVCEDLEPF